MLRSVYWLRYWFPFGPVFLICSLTEVLIPTSLHVIASHVAVLVKNDLCKIIAYMIISVLGIAFAIAMPSIIITLYFGEVSFIPVKPFLVKSGACVISDGSTSWQFWLLEAILVDVFTAGVCMSSCSLLTKSSRWWNIFTLS